MSRRSTVKFSDDAFNTNDDIASRIQAVNQDEKDTNDILPSQEQASLTTPAVEKPKKSELSNIAREKMEAMSKYNLKPATIGVKADLELEDDFNLTIVAKKFGKDKQKLIAEYILAGLEKDIKKIGIFEHKK